MTRRLYYEDPYLRVFDARIVGACQVDGRPAVVLDATAFYPTSGGQPHDLGTLNGIRVLDVEVTDEGDVVHIVESPLEGTNVSAEIDWNRRFDHMQQHTGQHILSQAFTQACGADTVGFHLGESVSTIDLDRAPLPPNQVAAAERLANAVVLGNREVKTQFVDDRELAEMPLRKVPAVESAIRIVQVGQFDWSPCGGTHVRSSGEVGTIKVVKTERRKQLTRVHFLCGWRAFEDYAAKQEILGALANHLTTSETEILQSVQRTEAQARELHKALTATQLHLIEYEAREWVAQAVTAGDARVVQVVFDSRDVSLLREAARRLTQEPDVVALLATRLPRPQFVFARSEAVGVDVGKLMRAACAAVGGRGGGSPSFSQGGGPEGCAVEEALAEAVARLADR